jgi:hypothetical protein
MQIWDRYLLPLSPMIALAIGWLLTQLLTQLQLNGKRMDHLIACLLLCLLLPSAFAAARGGLPLGGDHGDYSGLDEALAWLQQEAKTPIVLYHQQLGWHYRFYLYERMCDSKTCDDSVDLRWYPSNVYLANNSLSAPHKRKFLIRPDWAAMRELNFHLHVLALRAIPRLHHGKMTLYEVVATPSQWCNWCWSSQQTPSATLHLSTLPFTILPIKQGNVMICKR